LNVAGGDKRGTGNVKQEGEKGELRLPWGGGLGINIQGWDEPFAEDGGGRGMGGAAVFGKHGEL